VVEGEAAGFVLALPVDVVAAGARGDGVRGGVLGSAGFSVAVPVVALEAIATGHTVTSRNFVECGSTAN
jgi:hypothetical protein